MDAKPGFPYPCSTKEPRACQGNWTLCKCIASVAFGILVKASMIPEHLHFANRKRQYRLYDAVRSSRCSPGHIYYRGSDLCMLWSLNLVGHLPGSFLLSRRHSGASPFSLFHENGKRVQRFFMSSLSFPCTSYPLLTSPDGRLPEQRQRHTGMPF